MKKKIIYSLLILVSILFQISFFPTIFPQAFVADAVLMLVLTFAVIDGFAGALSWAIVAGILFDLISFTTVGIHVIIFLLTIYAVSFFSRRLSVEVRGTAILLLLLFTVFSTLISHGVLAVYFASGSRTLKNYLQAFGSFKMIAVQIFFNYLVFFILFNLVKKIKKVYVLD